MVDAGKRATCPECGTAMQQGARFCHACGWDARLPAAGTASNAKAGRPAWKRITIAIHLALFVVWLGYQLLVPRAENAVGLRPGDPAPAFTVRTLDGQEMSLASLKGKVVMLNFWATWCTPCREEMPDIQAVYDKYKDQGFVVVGVNLGEPVVTVKSFLDRVGATFPVVIDQENQVERAYRILPLPTSFFIDQDGIVRYTYEGQMRTDTIDVRVRHLLGQ